MEEILRYFPNLNEKQQTQLDALESLYQNWNDKINLISRKDIQNFYPHHVLHALSLCRFFEIRPKAEILDLGTGGGFPGIPMAIATPEARFTLIDGKKKKIMVVNDVIEQIELSNAKGMAIRAEELRQKFDFVVCRAVASIDKLFFWSRRLLKHKQMHALPNGLICLKGGANIKEELKLLPKSTYSEVFPLKEWYDIPYFEEKYIVYVQG